MEKCCKVAGMYVASLRFLYLLHQNCHWTVGGKQFYGDHQLFQRIYEAAGADADLAAEKVIGLFGKECMKLDLQGQFMKAFFEQYGGMEAGCSELALKAEQDFLEFSKKAYDCFKEEGKMTLGLDDMIMAIASNHESTVYLLKQRLENE